MGGCLGSTSSSSGTEQRRPSGAGNTGSSQNTGEKKQYSWDKRRQEGGVDLSRYKVSDLDGGTVIKAPGDVDGQHFIISKCKNTTILVFDHCAAVTVDDCTDCQLFIGPTKGSIFLRNCSNVQCGLVCQQFRSRDCKNISVLLFCATQPIIESCSAMKFGCLQIHYSQLEDQLKAAGIVPFNNCWPTIHDFTAEGGKQEWSLLPADKTVTTYFDMPAMVKAQGVSSLGQLKCECGVGVIPLTHGEDVKVDDQTCLVVIFEQHKESAVKFASEFFSKIQQESQTLFLVQTRVTTMSSDDCTRVFGQLDKTYLKLVEYGPVVGVEVYGDGCADSCREIITELGEARADGTPAHYVSQDEYRGVKDVEQFWHFISMLMSA